MKADLYVISNRLCKVACAAFLVRVFFIGLPHWLTSLLIVVAEAAAITRMIAGLADEVIERKKREVVASRKF